MECRQPGLDHVIAIEDSDAHVVVRAGGAAIAATRRAKLLREGRYPPVYYVPREDADMALLALTDHHTRCPYKGEASYYSVRGGAENAVWTYEDPCPLVERIRGHLAFYPDRVDVVVRA